MLLTRILTAIALLAPALVALWIGSWLLILVGLVVFAVVNYEYFSFATKLSQIERLQFTGCALLVPVMFLWRNWEGWVGGLCLAVIILAILCVMRVHSDEEQAVGFDLLPATALGVFYPMILGSFLVVIPGTLDNGVVAWLVLSVVIADTCAYFGGSALKGPKLSPRISPNKTVSGAICGIVGVIIFSVWLGPRFGVATSTTLLITEGFLIGVAAVMGDLLESLVKRAFNVKDTGSLLPGHGGLLDRVDALIFAAPIALLFS